MRRLVAEQDRRQQDRRRLREREDERSEEPSRERRIRPEPSLSDLFIFDERCSNVSLLVRGASAIATQLLIGGSSATKTELISKLFRELTSFQVRDRMASLKSAHKVILALLAVREYRQWDPAVLEIVSRMIDIAMRLDQQRVFVPSRTPSTSPELSAPEPSAAATSQPDGASSKLDAPFVVVE